MKTVIALGAVWVAAVIFAACTDIAEAGDASAPRPPKPTSSVVATRVPLPEGGSVECVLLYSRPDGRGQERGIDCDWNRRG